MNDNTKTSLWNKNVDDLTVGDAVKLNAAVLGGTLGLLVVVGAVFTAVDKIGDWKQARKAKKLENVNDV